MMNFDSRGRQNMADYAKRVPATEETDAPIGWGEATMAQLRTIWAEDITGQPARISQGFIVDQLERMKEYDPEIMPDPYTFTGAAMDQTGTAIAVAYQGYYGSKNVTERINKLKEMYPDQGFMTWDELQKNEINPYFAKLREDAQTKSMRQGAGARVTSQLAAGSTMLGDPMIAPFLTLGAPSVMATTTRQIPTVALKTAGKEAAIVGAAEVPAQTIVAMQKQQIESPYGLKDAVVNILTVAGGAGILRAGGSIVVDVIEVRKLAKAKRAAGGKQNEAEADLLEEYADLQETAEGGAVRPENQDIHLEQVTRAEQALSEGRPLPMENTDGVTQPAQNNSPVESFNPQDILVDAQTFQFKAGGDVAGVTERLKGVERWDPELAGLVMVWENRAGQRYIVDGHQRLALAKRAIAAGQPVDEVTLNGFILREADGVTAGDARQRAAMKNIAEDTGSAVDIAKVLREIGGEEGLMKMPQIPLTSAKVRDARGLSNLEDESFMMVVNDLIDTRYAAVVGDLITKADEQRAIMSALIKNQPNNLNQARIMVNAMREAGFEKRETMDLFGGQELTETLFKERAQVIDYMMRQVKQDKQVFSGLERNADRIVGAGNILDREANIERFTQDERTLAALTSLANVKGPISDAVGEAARRVKAGESVASASRDILPAIRQQAAAEYRPRPRDGAERPAVEAPTPERGKPVELQTLDPRTVKIVEREFKQKQFGRTVEQHHAAAKKLQTQLARVGNELQKNLGERIVFLNPGVKKLDTTMEKLARKGYTDPGELTDVSRVGFVVKDTADIAAIRERIARNYEVLDEGFVMKASGYYDQKMLVRAKDGTIGEIQLWEPRMLAVKEGKEFVDKLFPDHLKAEISDIEVPPRELSGHDYYERERALMKDGQVIEGKQAEFDALIRQERELYASAISSANISWKTVIDRILPESVISTGEAGFQSAGGLFRGMNLPEVEPPSGSMMTAGRPSQERVAVTSDQLKSRMVGASGDSISKDTKGIYGDDPQMAQMIQDDVMQAQRLMDELGDLDVPGEMRIDAETAEIRTEAQSLRQAFDDLAAEDRMIDDMFTCMEGGGA